MAIRSHSNSRRHCRAGNPAAPSTARRPSPRSNAASSPARCSAPSPGNNPPAPPADARLVALPVKFKACTANRVVGQPNAPALQRVAARRCSGPAPRCNTSPPATDCPSPSPASAPAARRSSPQPRQPLIAAGPTGRSLGQIIGQFQPPPLCSIPSATCPGTPPSADSRSSPPPAARPTPADSCPRER